MTTRMTINGVSTCAEAGTGEIRAFPIGYRKTQADTCAVRLPPPIDRELFSCVKPTLDECRAARDKWLNAKKGKEDRL